MRAAQIAEIGKAPTVVEIEDGGDVEIVAVALNPLDLNVANGRFYGGHPPLPYVPGCEAVARHDGGRYYLYGHGYGIRRDGFTAERTDFPVEAAVPVPEGLEDEVAATCGIAGLAGWMPLARRAPVQRDDRVLVLGATGFVGSVAVQAARLLGAERVVAAGRDRSDLERSLQLGADVTVHLEGGNLAESFRDACGGEGPTLVFDPLWGEYAVAATEAAAPNARIVQLGQSAAPDATLLSSLVRGKQLSILGFSVFALTTEKLRENYTELANHVAAGAIKLDVQTFLLDEVAAAWNAQTQGRKAVIRL